MHLAKMKLSKFNNLKILQKTIVAFFVLQISLIIGRSLLIGSSTASSPYQLLIALFPEVLILLVFIATLNFNRGNFTLSKFDIAFTIFILSNTIIGCFLSQNIDLIAHGIRLTYTPMIIYFIVRLNKDKFGNKVNSDKILLPIGISIFLFGIIGLILYFFANQTEKQLLVLANGKMTYYHIKRMGGVFLSPVVWGTFCSSFALYFYIKYAKRKSILVLIAFYILWFCLILSVSRGAIVPFYMGIIVITVIYKMYRQFIITTLTSVVIFSCFICIDPSAKQLIGFLSSSSVETMNNISSNEAQAFIENENGNDTSEIKNTRARFWALSIKSFKNSPNGYGIGKSGHVAHQHKHILKDGVNASIYSTDGWYLKLANETGIWGLISYFFIFIWHGIFSIKYIIKNRDIYFMFFYLIFIMVAIQNIMSNVLDFYSFSYFYWMIIGFMQNSINLSVEENAS